MTEVSKLFQMMLFLQTFFFVWWQPLDTSRRIGKKESILARSYLRPLAMLATKHIKIQIQASTSFRNEEKHRHQTKQLRNSSEEHANFLH